MKLEIAIVCIDHKQHLLHTVVYRGQEVCVSTRKFEEDSVDFPCYAIIVDAYWTETEIQEHLRDRYPELLGLGK